MEKLTESWPMYKAWVGGVVAVISAVTAGSLFITSKLATLDRLEAQLVDNEQTLSSVEESVGTLSEQLHLLEVGFSGASIRSDVNHNVHEKQDAQIQRIMERLGDIDTEVARIDEVVEMLKPLVTQGLALGRIGLDDVRKVYSPEEVGEFLEDAEKLFSSEGEGGAPGLGGGDLRTARGTLQSDGSCVGVARNCAFVSFNVLPNGCNVMPDGCEKERVQRARIEIFYGLDDEELAFLIPQSSGNRNEVLASAEAYAGRLCEWVAGRISAVLPPNQAA